MQACRGSGSGQIRGRFGQTIHAGVSGWVGFGLKNLRAGSGWVVIFRPVENSKWPGQNHLWLNISKTREMVTDFRKKRTASQPLPILGKDAVEYLGVTINHTLEWRSNAEAVHKKGMSRLFFLRKLRSFNMCSKMLENFYQSVVLLHIHKYMLVLLLHIHRNCLFLDQQ